MVSLDLDPPVARSRMQGRSFYAAAAHEFLAADPTAIVGQLSSRHVAFHASAEAEQIRAWEREITLLRSAFTDLGQAPATGKF